MTHKSDQRFVVEILDKRGEVFVSGHQAKGLAFASAKRIAAKQHLESAVTCLVPISAALHKKKDVRQDGKWWRAVIRWTFHPNGSADQIIYAGQ